MKQLFKSLIAALLCTALAISVFSTGTVRAAEKAQSVKITFNKKDIKLTSANTANTGVKRVKYKTLKEKWGKPTKTEKSEDGVIYTWEKGKTMIAYSDNYANPEFSTYTVKIGDKNGAIGGIKVGTKKKTAIKTLKDAGFEVEDGETYLRVTGSKYNITFACYIEDEKVSGMETVISVAKVEPTSVKVTFNKKDAKMTFNDKGVKEIKYKTLKEKWGKASEVSKEDIESYHCTTYIWKKGKSSIEYTNANLGSGHLYLLSIEDKNVAICGVTVGTKAKTAEKAFKDAGATVEKNNETYMFVQFNDYCRGECHIKNGKISDIRFTLYF